jgi:hypothetical protein
LNENYKHKPPSNQQKNILYCTKYNFTGSQKKNKAKDIKNMKIYKIIYISFIQLVKHFITPPCIVRENLNKYENGFAQYVAATIKF